MQTPEERIAELEANLLTVTDQIGGLMDLINQKGFVSAFRCGHSGLLLPSDYLKQWGRLYGVGLGPSPVSEVLDSDYDTPPPRVTNRIRSIEQVMHPVGPCMMQMDHIMVPQAAFDASKAIADKDDPGMERRAVIVRAKQLTNPRSRLKSLQAAYDLIGA